MLVAPEPHVDAGAVVDITGAGIDDLAVPGTGLLDVTPAQAEALAYAGIVWNPRGAEAFERLILDTQPLAFYPFGRHGLYDRSGHDRNAAAAGDAHVDPDRGGALVLDGSGDYLTTEGA